MERFVYETVTIKMYNIAFVRVKVFVFVFTI